MFKGKTHATSDLLANHGKGGMLHPDDHANPNDPDSLSVKGVLQSKHPPSQPSSPNYILHGVSPEICHVVFDSIDAHLVHSTTLCCGGAEGPFGLDAYAWCRLCTVFKLASNPISHLQMLQSVFVLPLLIPE